LETELIRQVPKTKGFYSVISETEKVDILTSTDNYMSDGLSYVGCMIQINKTPDKTKLVVKGIDFVCDRAIATSIKIFNLRSGLEVFTAPMAVTAGINEILINKDLALNFGSGLYFIGFLPTSGAVFTRITQEGTTDYITQKSGYLPIASLIGVNNVVEVEPYFNVLVSIEYFFNKVIEDNKELLATAFKYACGAIMMDWVDGSKEADRETLVNREGTANYAKAYRDDAVRFIESAGSNILSNMNKAGTIKPTAKIEQRYSLGSFV
jgi:hypothetical protein